MSDQPVLQANLIIADLRARVEALIKERGRRRMTKQKKLEAAAPDLLAALRGMEKAAKEIAAEFIEHRRATNWKIVNDAYVATARAIAKAEGRE